MIAAAKHQTKVKALARKKSLPPPREYYSEFAENVKDCYIPRFLENDGRKPNEEDRAKSNR